MQDDNIVYGTVTVRRFDEHGNCISEQTFANVITDVGDLYQATRIAAGVNSNGVAQPTLVTGMKLGSNSTASAKSGTGAALVSYITGTNKVFDVGYPTVLNLGPSLGVNVAYRCTWPTGVSWTASEIVLVTDAGTDSTSAVGSTIARSVFSPSITKSTTEAIEITWNHKQQGA